MFRFQRKLIENFKNFCTSCNKCIFCTRLHCGSHSFFFFFLVPRHWLDIEQYANVCKAIVGSHKQSLAVRTRVVIR